jgi:hypothetical protein
MTNQFQESLLVADRSGTAGFRLAFVQAAVGLALACVISIFGLVIASQAHGQDTKRPTANVLPELILSPDSQEPNLNGVLATGDGGAALPAEETIGGVSRDAFHAKLHTKSGTSPR